MRLVGSIGVALVCGWFAASVPIAFAQESKPQAEAKSENGQAPKAMNAGSQTEPEVREALILHTAKGDDVQETAAPGWPYPKAYAARPLTMLKHTIRATFLFNVKRALPGDTIGMARGKPLISIDMGFAFAIRDNLEVGVTNYRLGSPPPRVAQALFPIVTSPEGSFGDMPLYVRYRFLQKNYVEMAVDFVLSIPTWTNLSATFGLPVRIRTRKSFTMDTGLELVVLSNGAGLNVELPVKAIYNIRPAGFVFADSGFSFQNLARNLTGGSAFDTNLAYPVARNQVFVPLGVGGGYTHAIKQIVLLDVFARFGWNPFVYVNPSGGRSALPVADTWVVTAGVILHTDPRIQE